MTPNGQHSEVSPPSWAKRLGFAQKVLSDDVGVWVQGLSSRSAGTLAVVLMLLVAAGDELTGPDVSFTLLYLGPIGFATWFVSLPLGLALSVASAIASVLVDISSRKIPLPTAIAAWNLAVQLGVFLALVGLLSALKSRLESEQQLARTDPLTRLHNRRSFLEMATVELERARRTGRPLTVLYLDLDDFKGINDRLGHAAGDHLLTLIGATLRGETRSIDGVARLGGDEFGLLLVDTDGQAAQALVERLRSALAARLGEDGFSLGFSMGSTTFVAPPRSLDEMLSRADELMYEAKRSGKNQGRFEVVDRLQRLGERVA
ncbi:MAG TPA: GGDEF domain-containing protein [Anaeromyxobacteraceae bacterium]|nr:GGDEF domain-containing protein [Anaeromyxobacteraceae bacterium]